MLGIKGSFLSYAHSLNSEVYLELIALVLQAAALPPPWSCSEPIYFVRFALATGNSFKEEVEQLSYVTPLWVCRCLGLLYILGRSVQ